MTDDRLLFKVADLLQGDLAVTPRPFAALAEQLGCSEDDVLKAIMDMQSKGIMRRFGAVLRHQQAGYTCNAMAAWQCPPGKENEVGEIMASYPQVSHCYQRQVPEDFPYQLFTMIHARSEAELQQVLKSMAAATDINDYALLRSVKEYKKVSMRYQLEERLRPGPKEEV
jgi:DNA-binding Lrp family transcriptional regulator